MVLLGPDHRKDNLPKPMPDPKEGAMLMLLEARARSSEYMRIKQHANDNQRNLIEISFTKMDHHDTEIPEFPSLEIVGS